MSYAETRALPLKVFWFLSGQIDRIQADETLAVLPAHSIAMGGEHVPKVVEKLRSTIGETIVTEYVGGMTEKAKSTLKRLFGRN